MDTRKIGMLRYRYQNEKLEVYLIKTPKNTDNWQLPLEEASPPNMRIQNEDIIELDRPTELKGLLENVWAMEEKVESAFNKFTHIQQNEGTYIALKEAFKKIMPSQYAFLKELQEVLSDRNLVKNI